MKAAGRPLANILKRQISTTPRFSIEAPALEKSSHRDSLVKNVHYYDSENTINRLSMIYNAGSRYEDKENLGVTHAIRTALCLGEPKLIRKIECTGNLSCTTSRDHFTYTMESTLINQSSFSALFDAADEALKALQITKCRPEEIKALMRQDLAVLHSCPSQHVIELLHRAAYRHGGLGNSLYAPSWAIDNINFDMINAYTDSMFNFDNLHVVSTGIDILALKEIASNWSPVSGMKCKPASSKYNGGDTRFENGHDTVHVAVAMEGVGLNSKDKLVQGVLQHVMGTVPRIKYSPYTSKLGKAVSAASSGALATCFNMQYADTGLFGFQAVAGHREIGPVLKSVMAMFSAATTGKMTDDDIQRAKKCLLVELLSDIDSDRRMHERFSTQVDRTLEDWEIREALPKSRVDQLLASGAAGGAGVLMAKTGGSQRSQAALIENVVNKITKKEVEEMAKSLFSKKKPSMAAVGNLRYLPFLDELV